MIAREVRTSVHERIAMVQWPAVKESEVIGTRPYGRTTAPIVRYLLARSNVLSRFEYKSARVVVVVSFGVTPTPSNRIPSAVL